MARLEYSNLPPEAQQAVQKLTGCTHEELENGKTTPTKPQPVKTKKTKTEGKSSLKQTLLILAIIVGTSLIVTFAGYFVATH